MSITKTIRLQKISEVPELRSPLYGHVDGWQNDSVYGKLLSPKEQVKMPAVDESYQSIPMTAKRK